MNIPVAGVDIGTVNKKNVQKAMTAVLKEEEEEIKKGHATILAFDVNVSPEAEEFADVHSVKIMTAKIIYHLFDEFTEYVKQCIDELKRANADNALFPAIVKILKDHTFHNKDPILVGMNVVKGVLWVGTPLCVPDKEFVKIGKVESIEKQKVQVDSARPEDGDIAVKITGEPTIMVGR